MTRASVVALAGVALLVAPGVSTGHNSSADDLRRTAVVEAVERVGPAVVNVSTEELVRHRVFTGDDAEAFFHDFFEPKYRSQMETTSLGSGVLIDAEGHILTNFHVVQRGARIKVTLPDRREYRAKVLGTDPDLDLAVLKIEDKDPLPFVKMGDSAALLTGEPVIAIGNPFGLSQTVTTGIVSATHRTINAGETTFYDFIQTDASINPGNSGGPLLNIHGELIGINTAIYGRAQGIGFAIPINRARRISQDFIKYGEVRPAYVGMDLAPVDEGKAKEAGLRRAEGVLVVGVEAGGPAERGGVRAGDVLLAVEKYPILTPGDYSAKMRDYSAGNTVNLDVARGKERLQLTITAAEIPLTLADRILKAQLGMVVEELNGKNAQRFRVREQKALVIVSVDGKLQAGKARLQPGDIIRQVDSVSVEDLDTLRKQVIKARRRGTVEILVERGRAREVFAFKL
ncbi:MAG: trypsin-like peptidase domain-containing protein [Myxococcota bacterium]